MSARKGALTAPPKDQPAYCHDCEKWPAPVQAGSARLCEECAAKRRHPAGGKR
jgi:hypothetical protein